MFADPGISDDLMEKVVAFVEREAGRDAPLSAADEAMVRALLERDPMVQRLAEDLRVNNEGLDTLFDDVANVEVPDKLVALIRGHAANDVLIANKPEAEPAETKADGGNADIVQLSRRPGAMTGYGGLAAAASLAFLISAGTLLYVQTSQQEEQQRLEGNLAAATNAVDAGQLDAGQVELADASSEIERPTALTEQSANATGQASLQGLHDELLLENERLRDQIREQDSAFATADQQREQILADLSSMTEVLRVERGGQEVIVRSIDRQRANSLGDVIAPLSPTTSEAILADLHLEQQALQDRIAALEEQNSDLANARDLAEGTANTLRSNLVLAENTNQVTARRASNLETDLLKSKDWLGQIAQHHRVYASTDREHLVEVGADQEAHIEYWFETMLDRPVTVPDLSEHGLIFQGARLLGVNEKPVAQLVYLDDDDQPMALCIMPSDEETKEPNITADRDLNMVDWRDGHHGYAVIGWSDPEFLETIAQEIRPLYEL